jgi:Ca2+-dependent lipid-binding protein
MFNTACAHQLKSSSLHSKADSPHPHHPENQIPYNYFTNLQFHRDTELTGKQKLSSLYSSLGWAMRPSVYLLLSGLPLVIYFHSYSVPFACLSLGLATLYCIYCYVIQLQRQRVACALGVISDPDILELIGKSMPGWVLSPEKNRVDWVNHLLQAAWPMIGAFAENKVSVKAQEIFQKEKPDLLTSMELTNVVAGTVPPKILSINILNTQSTTHSHDKPTQVQYTHSFMYHVMHIYNPHTCYSCRFNWK